MTTAVRARGAILAALPNALEIDTRRVVWRRVVDMNDRALRQITASLGGVANGFPREAGFDITVASEVMAIFCLATDLKDLEERLGNIVLGYTRDNEPVTVRELNAHGAMTALLRDALQPNLVQTLENNPAFEDVNHLKIEIMCVPRRRALHPRHGANDMRVKLVLCGVGDAHLAVFEEGTQASGLERRVVRVGDGERLVSKRPA